jgi:transcription antitermination factor NusG
MVIESKFGISSGACTQAEIDANPVIASERRWYAVFTAPRSEKSAVKHLDLRRIESFLPIYETVEVWKNRQRKKITHPLFPSYLFVHIDRRERVGVLQSPGVLQIVGTSREPLPLQDSDIDFLRTNCRDRKLEPYCELLVGEKVRIKSGALEGVQGILVRRKNSMRFVLTLQLINQHAAVEVNAEDLEPVASR